MAFERKVPIDGPRVRTLRLRAGMGQPELAASVGIDQSYLSRIEGGKIKSTGIDRVRSIARALGVTEEVIRADLAEPVPEPAPAPVAAPPLTVAVELTDAATQDIVRRVMGQLQAFLEAERGGTASGPVQLPPALGGRAVTGHLDVTDDALAHEGIVAGTLLWINEAARPEPGALVAYGTRAAYRFARFRAGDDPAGVLGVVVLAQRWFV